jgi:deoxyribonuclease-4
MKLGAHVAKISHVLPAPDKKRKTMLEAINVDCSKLKLNACQIFVQGPRNSKMSEMDYLAIKSYCKDNKINLYVHSSYISVGIFSVNSENCDTTKSKYAVHNILKQLIACDNLGARGLVVHLTKRTPDDIIETLRVLYPQIKDFCTPLILEQPAKKPDGNKTYETPEMINVLTRAIMEEFTDLKWGWCIDTCHLWSAGIQLDKKKMTEKWLGSIAFPKKILLFHLNGGGVDIFGTGKDKHIIPFSSDDNIFGDDDDDREFNLTKIKKKSIWTFCQFAKKNNIDTILEINRGAYEDVEYAITTLHTIINK